MAGALASAPACAPGSELALPRVYVPSTAPLRAPPNVPCPECEFLYGSKRSMRRHLATCLTGEPQQRRPLTEAQNARATADRRAKRARARPDVADWCSGEVKGLTLMKPLLELCCVGIEGVMLTTEMEIGCCVVFRCADNVERRTLDVVDVERTTALASTTNPAHVEVLQHVQSSSYGACVGAARVASCEPHAMLAGSFFVTFEQVVLLRDPLPYAHAREGVLWTVDPAVLRLMKAQAQTKSTFLCSDRGRGRGRGRGRRGQARGQARGRASTVLPMVI
jgi:hypothetical protein